MLPVELRPLLEECRAMFDLLRRHAIAPVRPEDPSRGLPAPDGIPPYGGVDTGGREEKVGSHCYASDPRNADIYIGIRDGVSGTLTLAQRVLSHPPASLVHRSQIMIIIKLKIPKENTATTATTFF